MRLAYLLTPEEMQHIHEQVLELLTELSANLNPINYFLLYEYVIADQIELVKDIDKLRDQQEKWSDTFGIRLINNHFKQQENQLLYCEQEFCEIINELTESINTQINEQQELVNRLSKNPKEVVSIAVQLKKSSRQLSQNITDKSEELQATRSRLIQFKQSLMLDLVTRLNNKIHFEEYIDHILKKQPQLIILLIDIDYFGRYNEKNGQRRADSLLRSYAKILQCEHETKLVWRTGADEFILLLPYDNTHEIEDKINAIHKKLSLLEFKATPTQTATRQQPVSIVADVLHENHELTLKTITTTMNLNRNKGKITLANDLMALLVKPQ